MIYIGLNKLWLIEFGNEELFTLVKHKVTCLLRSEALVNNTDKHLPINPSDKDNLYTFLEKRKKYSC